MTEHVSYRMEWKKKTKQFHKIDTIGMFLVSFCYTIGFFGGLCRLFEIQWERFSGQAFGQGLFYLLREGWYQICTEILETFAKYTGLIVSHPVVTDTVAAQTGSVIIGGTLFALFFLFFFLFIRNGYDVVLSLLFLLVLSGGIFFGNPSGKYLTFMFVSLFFSRTIQEWGLTGKKFRKIAAGVLCFAGACFVLTFIMTRVMDESSFFSSVKTTIVGKVEKLRYGEDPVLPEGDFKKAAGFSPTGKTMLEIYMDKPESYYLRGFVGSTYTEEGWKELSAVKKSSASDLFYWLHEENFYGQTQLAELATRLEDTTSSQLTVKNVGASSKYMYMPYEAVSQTERAKKEIGDERFLPEGIRGERVYQYRVIPNQIKRYTKLTDLLSATSQKKESAYRNREAHYNIYVYERYLDLPEREKSLIKSIVGEIDTNREEHQSYTVVKQKILQTLTKSYGYEETPEEGEKEEFLEEFLQRRRSGYSVHFATAATLMFRYYGIPARYVEGYLITPEDIKGKSSNEKIAITDSHAHAWVEYYQDGVGFIPFEVTPGYLTVMESADDMGQLIGEGEKADNSEKEKEKREEKQKANNVGTRQKENSFYKKWVRYDIILINIVVFICVICLLWLMWPRIRRRRQIGKKDNRAVCLLFEDIMIILEKNKRDFSNAEFEKVSDIYGKARFSKHVITEDEFIFVYEFRRRLKKWSIKS